MQEQQSRMVLIAISFCMGAHVVGRVGVAVVEVRRLGGGTARPVAVSIVEPGIFLFLVLPAVVIAALMLAFPHARTGRTHSWRHWRGNVKEVTNERVQIYIFAVRVAIIPTVALGASRVIAFVLDAGLPAGAACRIYDHKDLPPMPVWYPDQHLSAASFLAIVILMIGYVNADSKRRGMNSLLWTLLVIFIPKALGFIAYFLLRKPLMMPCPKCRTPSARISASVRSAATR